MDIKVIRNAFLAISLILLVGLLSGCQEYLEDILVVIDELLDSDSTTEEVASEAEEHEDDRDTALADETDDTDSDSDEEPSDEDNESNDENQGSIEMRELDFIPFQTLPTYISHVVDPIDDRLKEQYGSIYKLPLGFPLPVPYQWILVEGDSHEGDFSGLFCFDIPQDIDWIATYSDHYFQDQDVTHNTNPAEEHLVHTTEINFDRDNVKFEASIEYGYDEFENTCAFVNIDYDLSDGIAIGELEEIGQLEESRQRSLPSNYAELAEQASSPDNFYDHSPSNSVKDAIYNEESTMLELQSVEVPKIFLYDSYLVRETDLSDGGNHGIDLLMCTDIPIERAVDKHLELLENYNADITDFKIYDPEENTSMLRVATYVDFAFNDEFGTGSWSGTSYFYRYEDDDEPFSEQRCMATEMEFTAELID